jgi:hypothetical protein
MKGMISMISHSEGLVELIDIEIIKYLKNFIYTTEKIGYIKSNIDSNGKYIVNIDNIEYSVPKKENDSTNYQINDAVLIRLSNGNFSRKYIECKKPNW